MGLGNILILTQVTAYLLSVIFALFMFIPIAVNVNQFGGHCLLEAHGTWGEDKLNVTSWGNPANCNFPVFIGAVSLPLGLFYVMWMSIYLFRGTEPSWLAAFWTLLLSCVVALMLLVCAAVLTHGFATWCFLVAEKSYSCNDAQYGPWFLTNTRIDTGNFYMQYEIAKFGAWTSFLCWLVLVACASTQLYRYHQSEDFLTSLSRERERLVQRVSSRHAYVPV